MSVKNIVSIIPYPLFPTTSGGRKTILEFNSRMSQRVQVHAVTVRYAHTPAVPFHLAEVFTPSRWRYVNPFYVLRIRKIIRDTAADFVIFEHPYMAWMGMLLKMLTGVKWAIRSHNVEYARFRDFGRWWWPVLKRYELFAYAKADAVLFITEDDRDFVRHRCRVKNSFVMPLGMNVSALPDDKDECREYLRAKHGIGPEEKILIYNGALDYPPNRQALDAILQEINPRLMASGGFGYRILVCGSHLDKSYDALSAYRDRHIVYCGYVDDITVYFKGADLYLNPVIGGGGIKTRLIESLIYNTDVVSTRNGSKGLYMDTVGDKVMIVEDYDWEAFSRAVITRCSREKETDTPREFYDYYDWDNIITRSLAAINSVISQGKPAQDQ